MKTLWGAVFGWAEAFQRRQSWSTSSSFFLEKKFHQGRLAYAICRPERLRGWATVHVPVGPASPSLSSWPGYENTGVWWPRSPRTPLSSGSGQNPHRALPGKPWARIARWAPQHRLLDVEVGSPSWSALRRPGGPLCFTPNQQECLSTCSGTCWSLSQWRSNKLHCTHPV